MDRRERLTKDACQLRRIDERHPAEVVEHLSVGEVHVSSVTKERFDGQLSHGSTGVWEGVQWEEIDSLGRSRYMSPNSRSARATALRSR